MLFMPTSPALDSRDHPSSRLFDFLPIGAYRSLPDGRVLRANPALVALNGYDDEAQLLADVHKMALQWYVDPARRELFRRLLERDGQVRAFVSQVRRLKTNELVWVSENAYIARDAEGQVLFYEGTVEEVTDRVEAERVLRDNEQRWKLALESAGDGVWDVDLVNHHVSVSPRLLQMYGLTESDHAGVVDSLDRITHPDDRAGMARDRDAHWRNEAPAYVNEHRMRHADGHWIWVLSRGMVIARDAQGRPLRMIGTHADISERREAEQLRRERDQHAAAKAAQSAFLSRVSHELRTPLNAIIGFAQLLEHDGLADERHRRWVHTLLSSGQHLLALVNDLLDLSSAQTGQLQFTSVTVPLAPLVADAWHMHATDAQAAGLRFDNALGADAPAVQGDPTRLKQVLSNLLSNAIKYNQPGGRIGVSARRVGAQVEISVSDSGHGMDASQIARLFNPFERVGAQHSAVAGTGLGLALSKQLVEAMGGEVQVDSERGRGSSFRLRLPRAADTGH